MTVQEEKYGYRLLPQTNFFQRHVMVKSFLSIQKKSSSGQTRKELALAVAATFGKGKATAENIIKWEKSWVGFETIPARKKVEEYASWLTDEDVVMAVREFVRKQGDSKKITLAPS